MKKLVLGLMVCGLVFMGGCSPKEKVDRSEPLIKVNGNVITQKMLKDVMDQNYKGPVEEKNEDNSDDPKSRFIKLVQKSRAINDLIIMELLNGEAEKRQINVSDEEVDNAISKVAKSMGGEEKLKKSLKQNNIDESTFKKTVKFDLLRNKLVESIMGKEKVSEAEIKKFYDENKEDKFKHADEIRASHILISASETDIRSKVKDENPDVTEADADQLVEKEVAEARKKAQRLYVELQKYPEKFSDYAATYSEDPSSAAKGGDLGFFSKGEMVPEFSKAAFATKPGNMSGIIKTGFGFHIIKVTDRKTAGITPIEEVKAHIERYLVNKKKVDTLQKLLQQAKEAANIEFVNADYDPQNIRKEYKALVEELRSSKNMQPADKPTDKAQPEEAKKL